MYKIYTVKKEKSYIKGYWKDIDGKLYIDNIKIIYTNNEKKFKKLVDKLFNEGEKSVFTEYNRKAYIYNSNNTIDILSNKKVIKYRKFTTSILKYLIASYNGFTIFKELGIYKIIIWN